MCRRSRAGIGGLVLRRSLRSKEEEIEYGPVRYEVRRVGFTPKAELINGRIAMAAITAATGLSISQGTFLNELLDGRLPQSWF